MFIAREIAGRQRIFNNLHDQLLIERLSRISEKYEEQFLPCAIADWRGYSYVDASVGINVHGCTVFVVSDAPRYAILIFLLYDRGRERSARGIYGFEKHSLYASLSLCCSIIPCSTVFLSGIEPIIRRFK